MAGVDEQVAAMQAAAPEEDDHPVSQLPVEFFTPLDSFDAVAHLLENLPERDQMTLPFLVTQMEQTQTVLDAINTQLSARVMRSYGAFVHGMSQVQQLESDLAHSAILCRSARRHLGRVQGGVVRIARAPSLTTSPSCLQP